MSKGRQSIFVAGPSDELATPDVYQINLPSVPTNRQRAVSDVGDAVKGLIGAVDVNSLLTGVVTDAVRGDIKSKDYALNLFKTAFPSASATVDTLKGKLIDNLASSIGTDGASLQRAYDTWGTRVKTNPTEMFLNQFPQARVIVDGIEKIKTIKDIKSASGLASLLGEVTGNSSLGRILNLDAQFKSVGALISTAAALGIPEFIDKAIGSVSPEDRPKAERLAAAAAAKIGDLPLLTKYVSPDEVGQLLTEHPNLINILIANYRFPEDTPHPTVAGATELINTLNQLKPKWFESDGKKTLETMVLASEEAISQLAMSDVHRPYALSSRFYAIVDKRVTIALTMPWTLV